MPAEAVERRLTAILTADVAGSCRATTGPFAEGNGGRLRYIAFIIMATCLTGCVASSGIIATGYPDEFFVNLMVAPMNGGGVAAYSIATSQAIDFCREHQRVFVVNNIKPAGDLAYPPTGTSLTFRCVPPPPPTAPVPIDLTRGLGSGR